MGLEWSLIVFFMLCVLVLFIFVLSKANKGDKNMKTTTVKAWQVAGEPDLYNKVVLIGRNKWECTGYSCKGNVRFSRLVPGKLCGTLAQVNIYVDPEKDVKVLIEEEK